MKHTPSLCASSGLLPLKKGKPCSVIMLHTIGTPCEVLDYTTGASCLQKPQCFEACMLDVPLVDEQTQPNHNPMVIVTVMNYNVGSYRAAETL